MKISDISLPGTVENEVQDFVYEVRLLLNNGKYQIASYAVAPSASDSGEEGEMRFVRDGATGVLYIYDGTYWWSGGFTVVT